MGLRLRVITILCCCCLSAVHADLAVPGWYDEGATVPDWHYRVPLLVPASAAAGSTVRVDVDFAATLTTLGVDSTVVDFDELSVRVVRPDGALVQQQEFTDRIFNGGLDPAGNARGEVRFILQDPGATTYLYFDIVSNGAKPTAPGVSVINGHFELSQGGAPNAWVRSAINAGGAQNNEVYRTNLGSTINLGGACGTGGANGLDTSPNAIAGTATGEAWHLLGYRDNCEDGSGSERIRLSRDLVVPAGGAAGVLEFYFQVQGFDGISNGNNYDWVSVYVDGTTVDHRALGINNAPNPQLRIDTARMGRNGYGGTSRDHGWKRAQLDLSAWAGSTINFRIESRYSGNDNQYRSWVKIDDVIWSRQDATLGPAQGFGVNLVMPADTTVAPASEYGAGQVLGLQAVVDAGAQSVSADLLDEGGNPLATGIVLFDDGSHGDATAGDNVWSNDGSIPAEPTYTFLITDPPGSGWLIRVFAIDAGTALGANRDGLILRPGQPDAPETAANFFNIDAQTFVLAGAVLDIEKLVTTLSDPAGGSQPKSLPGAWVEYDLRVTNLGPNATDADSVVLVDSIPAEVAVCVDPACTCVGPCTPLDPVAFDESGSPLPTGLTYSYATDATYSLDGTDYSYTPVADGAGFDPAVRYVRVNPTGALAAPDASGNPEFHLRYVVRVE